MREKNTCENSMEINENLSIHCNFDKRGKDICDALRDLVAFVQCKKSEKHPWTSVNFSKVAGLKHFFTFFKLYKWYQIAQRTTFLQTVAE